MFLSGKKRKTLALFLLLIFAQNVFFSCVSSAQSGPSAPQSNTFEAFDNPDTVNLLTGDMSYNLPVLEVPSPEGSFPVNLFYQAGIRTNQEASNYGLGWAINPGCINRSVNGYPDDYLKEYSTDTYRPTTLQTDYNKGFTQTGAAVVIPFASQYGSASVSVSVVKNSNTGKYGINSIGVNVMSNGKTDVGVNVNRSGSIDVSYGSFGASLSNKGEFSATLGNRSDANAYRPSKSDWTTVDKSWHTPLLSSINIRTYLDKKNYIEPFGALYLGHFSPSQYNNANVGSYAPPFAEVTNFETTLPSESMPVMDIVNNVNESNSSIGQTHIAYDDYQVNAPGIGGSIKPVIFENGSLMGLKQKDEEYFKTASFSKPSFDAGVSTNTKPTAIKFRYENETASNMEMPEGKLSISGGDPRVVAPTIISDNSAFFTPPSDNTSIGYINKYLKGKRHVEWFTDYEIKKGLEVGKYDANLLVMNAYQNIDPDFNFNITSGYDGYINPFIGKVDAVKIRSFKITAEDGMVYHFGLPVYAKNEAQLLYPTKKLDYSPNTSGPNYSNVIREKNSAYAYTWLLTGITGPDFIDNNKDGITDEGDSGYWVKFEYGKWTDFYSWRGPYENGKYDEDINSEVKVSSQGEKQLFYLNKIKTRTHSALFIHSLREDGIGANINIKGHASPNAKQLRTDEIRLFSNSDLKELEASYSFSTNSGATTLSKHYFSNVYDNSDINANATLRAKIKEFSLKTIQFGYNYTLCQNTINSISATKGKLTLTSLTTLGRNETKAFPPYKFEYNSNPIATSEQFDRWGYYKSDYIGTSSNRYVTNASKVNVGAWSLTGITLPTGGKLEYVYESDSYSRIGTSSFINADITYGSFSFTWKNQFIYTGCTQNSNVIIVTYQPLFDAIKYSFNNSKPLSAKAFNSRVCGSAPNTCCSSFSNTPSFAYYDLPITNINESTKEVTFDNSRLPDLKDLDDRVIGKETIQLIKMDKLIKFYPDIIYGGGIRVKQIITTDESLNKFYTNYDYANDALRSSGFTAIEPPHFDKSAEIYSGFQSDPNLAFFDGPAPGVMYSKVTVSQSSSNSASQLNKTEYSFIPYNRNTHFLRENNRNESYANVFKTHNKLNQVGQLQSIKNFDAMGNLLKTITYNYIESLPSNQGLIKECTNTIKQRYSRIRVSDAIVSTPNGWQVSVNEKIKYPFELKSVTTTMNSDQSSSTNLKFDFFTGMVLETESKNSVATYKTKVIKAKEKYTKLGSKADDLTNKNMLSQEAATTTFSVSANGTENPISSEVQTWSNSWLYRDNNADAPATDVWRKAGNYVWQGPTTSDGYIAGFADFWSSTNPNWKKANEITRYDHFSRPIESKNINGLFSATRVGYDNSLVLASASNANLRSFTYSGFEDKVGSGATASFGGEFNGGMYQSIGTAAIKPHTGQYLAMVPANSFGPTFFTTKEPTATNTNGLIPGRTYRASVWVHKASSDDAKLIAHLTGSSPSMGPINISFTARKDNVGNQVPNKIAGDWILMKIDITVPKDYTNTLSSHDLRVYLYNTGTTAAYYDDIRLHPIDAPMTFYVYEPKSGQVSAILDNENFATKFNYDDAGRLISTYKETLQGFKKLSSNSYNYGRQ